MTSQIEEFAGDDAILESSKRSKFGLLVIIFVALSWWFGTLFAGLDLQ